MPFDLIVSAPAYFAIFISVAHCTVDKVALLVQSGRFIPEKSNIWRDCVDGYYDWVKEHIQEVGLMMPHRLIKLCWLRCNRDGV